MKKSNLNLKNRAYLQLYGISDLDLQDIAIKHLPSGDTEVDVVLNDKTTWFVDATRALEVSYYKGLLKGLFEVQKVIHEIVK